MKTIEIGTPRTGEHMTEEEIDIALAGFRESLRGRKVLGLAGAGVIDHPDDVESPVHLGAQVFYASPLICDYHGPAQDIGQGLCHLYHVARTQAAAERSTMN